MCACNSRTWEMCMTGGSEELIHAGELESQQILWDFHDVDCDLLSENVTVIHLLF